VVERGTPWLAVQGCLSLSFKGGVFIFELYHSWLCVTRFLGSLNGMLEIVVYEDTPFAEYLQGVYIKK
jgi:hypothetical protein